VDARSADAVVVGAGHNGLVAAAYLAKAGLDVVVCERRPVVGGAAITEEIAPGFRASTASYALSLLRPDVYADLELATHGLEVVAKDPQMFVPLPDGRSFFVWRDIDRTCEEIAAIHRPDADGYREWCAFWGDLAPKLRAIVDDDVDPEATLDAEMYGLAVTGSAADLVQRFFEAPEVQGAFASQGIIGTSRSVRHPGTAWVMSYHALGGDLYGSQGTWGYVRGGMGALAWALYLVCNVAGASVRRDSPVAEILVDGGRAAGVRLDDGTVLRAPTVLSGADPKTTFLGLVPGGALDEGFVRTVEAWDSSGCVIKVNLALSELPEFVARPGEGPQHRGTIEISPSIDYLHAAYEGGPPFMEGFVQSAVDPSLVDGEGHVLSLFAQYATDGDPAKVIETFAKYAPNVPDAIVGCDALGPQELESRFGLWGGNIFHGEITPNQSFGNRFDYRTPLPGLYLCGSGARPGGGVMGAAGRNAARAVLHDLDRG
jgi:phytoene dehydrogenase-like protein